MLTTGSYIIFHIPTLGVVHMPLKMLKNSASIEDHTRHSQKRRSKEKNPPNRRLSKVAEVRSREWSLRIDSFPSYLNEKFLPRRLKSFSIPRQADQAGSSLTACCPTTAWSTVWLLLASSSRSVAAPTSCSQHDRGRCQCGVFRGPFHVSLVISRVTVSVMPWRMQRGRNTAFFGVR